MTTILVVGGGFAGMAAALAAKSQGKDLVRVRLISRDPYLVIRPRLYEAAPERLTARLDEVLRHADIEFREGEVSAIDERAVSLLDGSSEPFDSLVVASGSRMQRPPIPGADLAHSIDNLDEALAFDARLKALARIARPKIAVIGAGFTGIELALELRDRLAAHGAADQGSSAQILLVDRAPVVGLELGDAPRPLIMAALDAASIELRLNAAIASISSASVTLDGGDMLEADAVILCTGLAASPLARLVGEAHDRLGRIVVDRWLRVPGVPDVFAAGDAALAECEPGRYTLMSCQHARASGEAAGQNAARTLLGLQPEPYRQDRYVTCLDLGRSGAMFSEGWARVPQVSGAEAKQIKHRINRLLIYPPGHPASDFMDSEPLETA